MILMPLVCVLQTIKDQIIPILRRKIHTVCPPKVAIYFPEYSKFTSSHPTFNKTSQDLKINRVRSFMLLPENYQQLSSRMDFCFSTYVQVNKSLSLTLKNEKKLQEKVYGIYGKLLFDTDDCVSDFLNIVYNFLTGILYI